MRSLARSFIGFAIVASALSPAVATAQKTSYDFRQRADFARPRTFAFKDNRVAPTTTAKTTTYDSPFVDERTNVAIAAELERRGWTRDDADPEVYVITNRTFKTEYTTYSPYWNSYYWPTGWWGPYGWGAYHGYGYGAWDWGPMYTQETIRGTLAIDLEEAASGELMWRGVGSKHVHESSKPSSRARHVNEEVADIFKNFPPGSR
jgi:hypothetical protein